MVWIQFLIVSVIVVVFGYIIATQADKLAEAKNFGKGLVGFILLGFTTSIPELISTLSSTIILNNPLMGSGNIIGSNNANMLILFVSFLMVKSLRKKNGKHDGESLVSLSFCLIITTIFMIAVILSGKPFVFTAPVYCYLILFIFAVSIYELYKVGALEVEEKEKKSLPPSFYIGFAFSLAVLIVASYYLSFVVDRISKETAFGATESGAIFLAWSTSLPELAVTVSALIIGSSELGIGNILGSNIFNMFVISVSEIFSRSSKPVFDFDKSLVFLSMLQILLLSMLLLALSQNKLVKIWKISFIPLCAILLYVGGMVIIF